MTLYDVEIRAMPMSMNERERASWRKRRDERIALENEIGWAFIAAGVKRIAVPRSVSGGRARPLPGAQQRFVKVTLVKGPRGKTDDPANRDARAKSYLDALVNLGYLVDDSDEWLDWMGVTEVKGPDGPRTVITIGEHPA